MPDENIDYKALYEQVVSESEQLREQLFKLKFATPKWTDVNVWLDAAFQLFTDPHYIVGLIAGVFIALIFFMLYMPKVGKS